MTRSQGVAALVLLTLSAIAASGLGALEQDGPAAFALADDHPVSVATELLESKTAGEDLLVVVVEKKPVGSHGLIDPEGVAVLESVTAVLESMPEFDVVRSVVNASIVTEVDGAMTAATPLRPPPESIASWSEARSVVLSDPFTQGQLVGPEGQVAAAIAWRWRGGADAGLVRRLNFALKDESFRESAAGTQLQEIVNEVRMAIAFGDLPGPDDVEIAKRLSTLEEPGAEIEELLSQWRLEHGADDDDVIAALRVRLSELESAASDAGIRLGLAGKPVTEAALTRHFPPSVARALGALALLALLVGFSLRRRPLTALAAGAVAPVVLGVCFGLYGATGVPLHPLTACLAFLAAWWALTWGVGRTEGAEGHPLGLLLWVLPLCAGASAALTLEGGAVAGCIAELVAVLAVVALFPRPPSPAPTVSEASPVPGLVVSGLVLMLAVVVLAPRGVGVDPSRLLASSSEAGWPAQRLAETMGTVPAAYLVAESADSGDRPFAAPRRIAALRETEEVLRANEVIAGSLGWSDFVASLHRAVSKDETTDLPQSGDAVEQYLLLFARPEETTALVSTELDVTSTILRSVDGMGAKLASLDVPPEREGVRFSLAGAALAMMVSARDQVRRAGWALAALGLFALALPVPRGGRNQRLPRLLGTLAAAAAGLAGASVLEGAVTPVALLGSLAGAGLVAGSWSWNLRAALTALALGAAAAFGLLASPVVILRALGVALSLPCVLGWLLRLTRR